MKSDLQNPKSFASNFRRKRMLQLANLIEQRDLKDMSVLDIGGTISFLEMNLKYLPKNSFREVDIVNLPPLPNAVAGFHTHPDGNQYFSGPGSFPPSRGLYGEKLDPDIEGDQTWARDYGPLYMSYAEKVTGNIRISICNAGTPSCDLSAYIGGNLENAEAFLGDPVQ